MTVQILLYNYMGDLVGRAISCLDLPVQRTGRGGGHNCRGKSGAGADFEVPVPVLRCRCRF